MTNETSRIHFHPWAGTNYEHGIGGKRLLALGESHYPDTDDPEQTQTVMKKLLANKQSQFAGSATAFEEVLNEYGPDLIIAWGRHCSTIRHYSTDAIHRRSRMITSIYIHYEYTLRSGKTCRIRHTAMLGTGGTRL